MKRFVTLLVGAAITATVSFAQTNVLSQNAVGYVKVTANPGDFVFVQTPFETIDGSTNTIETVFPDVPVNTAVSYWDDVSQIFVTVNKVTPTFWFPANVVVTRGQGLFVKIAAAEPDPVDMYLMGEVPGTNTWQTTDIALVEGFNAIGNPYPTTVTIENSGIDDVADVSDQVAVWKADTQGYLFVNKVTPTFWFPANTELNPGDAVFLRLASVTGGTYTETVPYTYPTN